MIPALTPTLHHEKTEDEMLSVKESFEMEYIALQTPMEESSSSGRRGESRSPRSLEQAGRQTEKRTDLSTAKASACSDSAIRWCLKFGAN